MLQFVVSTQQRSISKKRKFSSAQIAEAYFSPVTGAERHRCKACNAERSQKLSRGTGNLVSHIEIVHKSDYENVVEKYFDAKEKDPRSISSFALPKTNDKGKLIYAIINTTGTNQMAKRNSVFN